MKKRSREINIFSMSALDLFASAMGAFHFNYHCVISLFSEHGRFIGTHS